jgi:hypothetical protein
VLTPSDFVYLDFTNELTQGGIAYACRSLVRTFHPYETAISKQIHQVVTEIAVELAFRRYLVTHRIPHVSQKTKPFTQPDRQNLYMGGRMCQIKSLLITHRDTISCIRKDRKFLLQTPVKVPINLFESDHLTDKDILIFAYATGLVTSTKIDLELAVSANQPSYCIQLLPKTWSQPTKWRSLGELVLSTTNSIPVTIEISGSSQTREFLTERLHLLPQEKTYPQSEFYSINLLHNTQIHGAKINIYSPTLNISYFSERKDWSNIWVYGMEIILVGFITLGEFKQLARPLTSGGQVIHSGKSSSRAVMLSAKKLRPLADLFRSAKDWSGIT